MTPPSGGAWKRRLRISAMTGIDSLIWLLPRSIAVPWIARRVMKTAGAVAGPGDLIIDFPDGSSWEVLNAEGDSRRV